MKNAVIGAGPSGILTVWMLKQLGKKVYWFDPFFNCGQFKYFYKIPTNDYSTSLHHHLRSIKIPNDYYKHYSKPFPYLDEVYQTFYMMTKQLKNNQKIQSKVCTIRTIKDKQGIYEIGGVEVDQIWMCQGTKRIDFVSEKSIHPFHLMSEYYVHLFALSNKTIQVHGSNFPALLSIKNMLQLKTRPARIYHYISTRKLRLAKQQQNNICIQKIVTGLKLQIGKFGKLYNRFLQGQTIQGISGVVEPVYVHQGKLSKWFTGQEFFPTNTNYQVFQLGYKSNQLPDFICEGVGRDLFFDQKTGEVKSFKGERMWGVGIGKSNVEKWSWVIIDVINQLHRIMKL